MTEHVLYFWFCWLLWVLVTFFMKKSGLRTYFAIWVLITIILADFFLQWNQVIISLPFIALTIGAVILTSRQPRWFFHLAASFSTAIGYATFLFWEMLSPVWFVMPRAILMTMIFGLLISLLVKPLISKITVCLLGMAAGEVIYLFTLFNQGILTALGDKSFFINLFTLLLFFITAHTLHRIKEKIFDHTEKYKERMMEVVK